MVTRSQFAGAVLTKASLAESNAGVLALVAVMDQENTAATWNPCATTEPWDGSTDLPGNEAHVQEYRSFADGVAATAATLTNGRYPGVVGAIGRGEDAEAIVTAWAQSPWGTWGGDVEAALAKVREVEADPEASYKVEVTGPEAPPEPAPGPEPEPEPGGIEVQVPQIQEGSNGGAVAAAQAILNGRHGAGLVVDGDYGPLTHAAVVAWQDSHGLAGDGIVGAQTWESLVS